MASDQEHSDILKAEWCVCLCSYTGTQRIHIIFKAYYSIYIIFKLHHLNQCILLGDILVKMRCFLETEQTQAYGFYSLLQCCGSLALQPH